MSKTCFAVHGFAGAAFERHAPELAKKPYALLDVAGRVVHASEAAGKGGILSGMTANTVRATLPECDVRVMRDEYAAEASQEFFDVLASTGLACEKIAPGAGYLDLTPVANTPQNAREVVADLGRQLRDRLGNVLTPSIGWGDMAKAVARAAAIVAKPGTMRFVPAREACNFMAPLPTTYLPLPVSTVLQLKHLGISTCEGLASLSSGAVKQRWGTDGVEAQKLARGEDRRPIRPELTTLPEPVEVDYGGPVDAMQDVVQPLVGKLTRTLAQMAQPLEGILSLSIAASAWDKSKYAVMRTFGEPLTTTAAIARVIETEIGRFSLTAPITALGAQIMAIGECELRQLSLFDVDESESGGVQALPEGFRSKYGSVLQRPVPNVVTHPILARRYRYEPALAEL